MVVVLKRRFFKNPAPLFPSRTRKIPKPPKEGSYTPFQDQEIIEGMKAGRSYTEIGSSIGKNRNQVAGRVTRLRDNGADIIPRKSRR